MFDATFTDEGIQFAGYPFWPAAVYPDKLLRWSAIRELNDVSWPPQVRTQQGEVVFVPASRKDELIAAISGHNIPIVARNDVWDMLLDPFLDTEFGEAETEATIRRLEANGVTRAETEAWRARVGDKMLTYNAVVWEWVHLGQFDLFLAYQGNCGPEEFEALYWQSMEIADRGQVRV